jgi:hypothetical protein
MVRCNFFRGPVLPGRDRARIRTGKCHILAFLSPCTSRFYAIGQGKELGYGPSTQSELCRILGSDGLQAMPIRSGFADAEQDGEEETYESQD